MSRSGLTGPPRVGTAPLMQDGKSKTSIADFRTSVPTHQPVAGSTGTVPRPHQAGAGLPGRPPAPPAPTAAAAAKSPQPDPVAVEALGASPSPSPAAASEVPYPEDCIYEVNKFILLKQSQQPIPAAIMAYAGRLWKEMPENMSDWLRENLFKEGNATMPSKVMTDRKLHNEVLGILGKVTEDNLERMKKELTDLPIRQSTDEEISEVITTIFRKCVRPEDSVYTPLYVKLIKHLVNTIGEHEVAGGMIRREIIFQCRDTFLGAQVDAKNLEDRIAGLPEEEINLERMVFAGKQKANVQFLGLLFCAGIAAENVVLTILESLLYGDGKRRRVVPDYSAVHFMDLLTMCGPHISKPILEQALPRFIRSLDDLHRMHPSKRIQILIENFLDTVRNNWVPLHGRSAQRHQQGGGGGGAHGGHGGGSGPRNGSVGEGAQQIHLTIPDLKARVPDLEEFYKVMDDFFATSEVDEISSLIDHIPVDMLIAYLAKWIGRYITTYRYAQERTRLGELFERLAGKGAVSVDTAQAALRQHVSEAIDEDLFTDQPKYFTHWAAVIRNGRGVFPLSLHTALLDMLVAAHVSRHVIVKMITDVNKAVEEAARPEQREHLPRERFRALQALLRYTPPLLSRGGAAAGDGHPDDADLLDDEDADEDIIDFMSAREADVEVTFFKALCDSYDESNVHEVLQTATEALKKSHAMAFPLFSAFFTFVRYDVDTLCTTYREILKKICSLRPLASLLEEAYVQWTRLECPDSYFIAFVKKVVATLGPSKSDPIERLRERLRADNEKETLIYRLEKAIKQ